MSKKHKLWEKEFSAHQVVEQYTTNDDLVLDQELIGEDVLGNLAHIAMLRKVRLLSTEEYKQLQKSLHHIWQEYSDHNYLLSYGDEDVHTRIENDVTEQFPVAGAKIHTGRSRNDQVLTDLRIYTKRQLLQLAPTVLELASSFLEFAEKYEFLAMPGYTHMQTAMLSSVGLWAHQFSSSLLDDMLSIEAAFAISDQSPLGSGAGYGISLPLDREYTAKLLGFSKVQENALYCQNSRGKIEAMVLHSLSQLMLTAGRFAQDLLLFTTSEFQFFTVAPELTTGSSIMPQKRNLDILELVRARTKTMLSYEFQVSSIAAGLPSGYNRDVQEMKKPFMAGFELAASTLEVLLLTLQSITPNEEEIAKHITPELFAAHHSYEVMKAKNIPFREAYIEVGTHLQELPHFDSKDVLVKTKTVGAPGNLNLLKTKKDIFKMQKKWEEKQNDWDRIVKQLLQTS